MSIDTSGKERGQGNVPRNNMGYHQNYVTNMQLYMGIETFFDSFLHQFQSMRHFMKMLKMNQEAIRQGIIGKDNKKFTGNKKSNVIYDPIALQKIEQIWYGQTWLINVHDPRHENVIVDRFFSYDNKVRENEKAVWMPQLSGMCPLGKIDDMTWGLRLPIPIPASLAFEGCKYEEIVLYGKYVRNYGNETKLTFKDMYDVKYGGHMVQYVSRHWWQRTVSILQYQWENQHNILFMNQHRMLNAERENNDRSYGFGEPIIQSDVTPVE